LQLKLVSNMHFSFNTPLDRFRTVAVLEGISYLVLLFIAMPLKRLAGIHEVQKYVGWAHGLLFILFMALLVQVWVTYKWSFYKVVVAFVASLIPFGTFILDKRLEKEETQK
jgi:integral membrane protein